MQSDSLGRLYLDGFLSFVWEVAVCSPSPGHHGTPKSPAQFSAQKERSQGLWLHRPTSPPAFWPGPDLQPRPHVWGNLLTVSIPDISCLSSGAAYTHAHTRTEKHAHQQLSMYTVPYTVCKAHSSGETRQLNWRCKLLCVER